MTRHTDDGLRIVACDLCDATIATANRELHEWYDRKVGRFLGLDVCRGCSRQLRECGAAVPARETLYPVREAT